MHEGVRVRHDMKPIIEIAGLCKSYRTDTIVTHALQDADLVIDRGEYVALMGRSGSGKTSLLAILGLLDAPSAGEYRLAQQSVGGLSPDKQARVRNAYIGFVFQSFNLIGDLSVHDNVELPLIYRGGIPSGARRQKVGEWLDRVGMRHRERHFPNQLSGGEAQRVAIARALVTDPLLILADEPTGNLDSASAQVVMDLLDTAHRATGATILVATHDSQHAARAHRIIRLVDGRLLEEAAQGPGDSSREWEKDATGGPP